MNYTNRLSEYFAEMDEIARTDPIQAIKLKHEHLKLFMKNNGNGGIFSTGNVINSSGFGSCIFLSGDSPVPFSEDYKGSFTCIDGKMYDDNGNQIDLDDPYELQ